MDKQEFAALALVELGKMEKRRVQVAPQDMLKELFKAIIEPPPPEDNSPTVIPIPKIEPEFPKLLVDYEKKQFAIVENWNDWAPIHHFWVRPMSELQALKQAGFTERPKTDWERRKQ